jgi:uncharacterized phage protein (TIGR02220 family)
MSEKGWVCIYRKIRECWVWEDKPFSKGQAWIDLVLSANHDDKKVSLGNELVLVERGSFITSEVKLMERWGWGKQRVRAYLKMLEQDGMIIKKTDHKKTTITIVNYSDYQDSTYQNQTVNRPPSDHDQTVNRPSSDTNNNYNNDNNSNNDNKIYIPCREIIDYLNLMAGTAYKNNSKKTQTLIHARFAEKFTLDDFKTVIDKKAKEWKGTDFEKFLRPETLFGPKFESYLNQKPVQANQKPGGTFSNYDQRKYDMKELEKKLLGRDEGDENG